MGLFRLVHDALGIDRRKVSKGLKNRLDSAKNTRDRLRNSEKVRRLRY